MYDLELEEQKNQLIERAAECFGRNNVDDDYFESLVNEIHCTHDGPELRALAQNLESCLA